MKPLLMIVALHPARTCRAKQWLETPENKKFVDIKYLKSLPGEPIYGSQGQLYTCASFGCAMYNTTKTALKQDHGKHKYFGTCCDDVLVTTPNCIEAMLKLLEEDKCDVTGIPHSMIHTPPLNNYCYRLTIAKSNMLKPVEFMDFWRRYEFSGDWEGPWHEYLGLKPMHYPGLEWNHFCPASLDASKYETGWWLEYFKGETSQIDKSKLYKLGEV